MLPLPLGALKKHELRQMDKMNLTKASTETGISKEHDGLVQFFFEHTQQQLQ